MELARAIELWREGERRLQASRSDRRPTLDRVSGAIVGELRRRLGGRFTAKELADLYSHGTSWCLQSAMRLAPEQPWAWDSAVVVDAAFCRYLREAADYAGGRHVPEEQ